MLNHVRYEEEVRQGLHDGRKGGKSAKRGRSASEQGVLLPG